MLSRNEAIAFERIIMSIKYVTNFYSNIQLLKM